MYANVSFHFISEIRNSTLWNKKGISKWSLSPTTFDRFEISCTNCPLNIFDIYYIKNVKTRRVRIPKNLILISTISTTQHNQDRDLKCFDDKLCQFNSLLSKASNFVEQLSATVSIWNTKSYNFWSWSIFGRKCLIAHSVCVQYMCIIWA